MVGCGNDVTDLLPPYSSKTSRATDGDRAVAAARLCRLGCHFHDPDLSAQFGVIILGLCCPSNSLFEYSASIFGLNQWGLCDALFSNYFEEDLLLLQKYVQYEKFFSKELVSADSYVMLFHLELLSSCITASALTLLVGRQEEHMACKN